MTIKYLDSKRISLDATFSDNFSSDTWTGCKNDACDSGAPTTVTISGGDLSAVNVNVALDDRMVKALGTTLSNTTWVLQFETNVASTSTHSTLVGLVTTGGNMNNTSILCDYNASNKIIMREYNSGLTEMGSGISISTGTQYYVTVIRTSLTGLTLEVRTGSHTGTLVGSESGTITGATGLTYVQSGAYGRGTGTATYDIDNIKIYDGVTTVKPTNVQDNSILVEKNTANRYWLGQSKVSSNDGTNNGATTGETGKTGSAWDFDGSNDYVQSGFTDNLGTQFSVSMWMKFDSKASWDAFLGKGTSDANEEFLFYIGSGSNCIGGEVLDDVSMEPSSGCTISPNFTTWYHVTYTIDGTAGSYYVYIGTESGTPTQYTSANTTAETNTGGTNNIQIGGNNRQGSWFDGKFDQILVYNKVLTQSEVNTLHNSGSGTTTPDTSGLILYYNFDQTGSTLENQVTTPTWTMEPTINNNIYGSSSGWDLSSSTDITLDTVNKGVTLGDVDETNGIGRGLGFTASNDKWILRFKFEISELHGNDHGQATITSDHTVNYNTSSVESLTCQVQGSSYWRFVLSKNDQGSSASDTSANNSFSLNTTYYIEMIRDGDTVTETIRTGSHSGSVVDTLSVSGLTSGFTLGLDGIQHWSYSSSSEYETGWVRNVEFYNGVTTIN